MRAAFRHCVCTRMTMFSFRLIAPARCAIYQLLASRNRLAVARCMSDMVDPPGRELPIPNSYSAKDESLDAKRSRLLYQSRKRGMLENDLLLSTFAAKNLPTFSERQLELYDRLINTPSNDWHLYYWMTDLKETPEEFQSEIMDRLKIHVQNLSKERRLRQPDLNVKYD